MDELADVLWPVAVWFAERPVRILYAVGSCAIIGFTIGWSARRKGK